MIRLENLWLSFGEKQILQDFSLAILPDGVTCLQGPSGIGKTTLLRLIAGLSRPDRGAIVGTPKKPAFLFQEDRLLPHFSAFDNVAAALPVDRRDEAGLWLERVGLSDDFETKPQALSGGMRRRVALARALAYGGDYLLLDEPFTGLDAALAAEMAALIRATGTPALVITHADDEVVLFGGRVIALDGPPMRVVRGG